MFHRSTQNVRIQFSEKLIVIENGEIVFARMGSDRFDEFHDLKKGQADWNKVRTVVYTMFHIKSLHEELDEAMRYLGKDSQGYAIFKTFYQEEAKKLQDRLAIINSLLADD